ncbi:unnamed protein product [Albugo candida]|uniref:B30.2/SPRY domain-containing protein n=1 Tax=Albugo candida TaxID=65357 RepID=A0A024FYP8_9STRA|nr:unnamed protein product [Albugo candida]|eukprot:CCI39393.1 unnamed protein product [Albugo candida]
MVSIGFANAYFHLVDKQPGWDIHSYGYHGDDGRYYHNSGRGVTFGPRFNVGDTVGCGYKINRRTQVIDLFFTKNGQPIPAGESINGCDLHDEMYPVVGIDSTDAVHFNLGQEPFQYDFVDELFENMTHADVKPETYLPWLILSDNERESDSSETDDEPMIYSNLEVYMRDMVEMMDDGELFHMI